MEYGNSVSQETEAFSKVFELEDWGNFLCNAFSVFSRSSCVQLFATPWMVAHQIPLSMGLFRQEYWRGLPFPSPGDLPDPRTEPVSPPLASGFFTNAPLGKPRWYMSIFIYSYVYMYAHSYNYSLYAAYYSPRTYLFYDWKLVPFYCLHQCCPFSSSHQPVLCIYEFRGFSVLDFTYRWLNKFYILRQGKKSNIKCFWCVCLGLLLPSVMCSTHLHYTLTRAPEDGSACST